MLNINDKLARPLKHRTLRQRVLLRLVEIAGPAVIAALGASTRFKIEGIENYEKVLATGVQPICVFWHDRVILATYFFRGNEIRIMTSRSSDGEYIARVIGKFGYKAVRGSSSRGGARALVEMIKAVRQGYLTAFTIDGPRGPRYVAKQGPIILAKATGTPILPFIVEPKHFWSLKSWDKMQIPRPFTQALVIGAEPIYVKKDADDAEIAAKLSELQDSLDNLVERGKKWREG